MYVLMHVSECFTQAKTVKKIWIVFLVHLSINDGQMMTIVKGHNSYGERGRVKLAKKNIIYCRLSCVQMLAVPLLHPISLRTDILNSRKFISHNLF